MQTETKNPRRAYESWHRDMAILLNELTSDTKALHCRLLGAFVNIVAAIEADQSICKIFQTF